MKKVFITGLILVGLASCSKEYTCKCTSTFDDGSTSVKTEDYFGISKSQAETNCKLTSMDIANANSQAGFNSKVDWSVTLK